MKTRDEFLWNICKKIYRAMYREAEPKANFTTLMKKYKGTNEKFFMRYYLDADRQCEIISTIFKKHFLRPYERNKISNTVHLGCSPNTCRKTWEKARKDYETNSKRRSKK